MRRLLALGLVLAGGPALAQDGLGGYIGLGIGTLDYEDTIYNLNYGDSASNLKFTGGYRFNETLAFEGYYGESDTFVKNMSGFTPLFLDQSRDIAGFNYNARLEGSFEVLEFRVQAHTKWVVLGLGYFMADLKGSIVGDSDFGPFDGTLNDSESGYSIIVGFQWDHNDWGIRAEYEYFDVSSPADATILGLGIHYGF